MEVIGDVRHGDAPIQCCASRKFSFYLAPSDCIAKPVLVAVCSPGLHLRNDATQDVPLELNDSLHCPSHELQNRDDEIIT